MKNITLAQINGIETINGTFNDRGEYIAAVAKILGADLCGVRWNVNTVKAIALDDEHIVDIGTKTIKGQRFVTGLSLYRRGTLVLVLERKKGVWLCFFDRDWFEGGNWKEGAEQLKSKPYRG